MRTEEFKRLVDAAGLVTLSDWLSRFVVGLSITVGRNTHVESEVIEYLPAEFAVLSSDAAQRQIGLSKARLEKAAIAKLRVRV